MTQFLGYCHVSGETGQMQLVAAAFCADRPEFETLVGAALAAQGYRLDWAEDVLPAGPWVARHPAAGGAALARSVHEGRHVALGPMTPLGGADATPEEDQNWLHVEEIGPVTPLDAQFGVHPKKSVPDALQDALFGQPEPSEAERAAFGENTPPLATYAVLDAAKMPYLLTSLLESSGLRYQSLFQGAAQEELGEHAPYLVELKDGHDFTRRLFTGPDGINGLWEKELGIFIRSRAGFDALRKHLRKFTRVQDEEGKWFYFRFWEAQALPNYLCSITTDAERVDQWVNGSGCTIHRFITCNPSSRTTQIAESTTTQHRDGRVVILAPEGRRTFRLDAREHNAFRHHAWLSFLDRLVAHLSTELPEFSADAQDTKRQRCHALATRAYSVGFEIEKAVADFCLAAALYPDGKMLEADAACRQICSSAAHQIDKAGALLALVRTLVNDPDTTNSARTKT